MYDSGLDQKHIIAMDWDLLEEGIGISICKRLTEYSLVHALVESIYDSCIRTGIQHIPKLCLAKLSLLIHPCPLVIGVDLYGQVFPRINQLDEYREAIPVCWMSSKILGMESDDFGKGQARELT